MVQGFLPALLHLAQWLRAQPGIAQNTGVPVALAVWLVPVCLAVDTVAARFACERVPVSATPARYRSWHCALRPTQSRAAACLQALLQDWLSDFPFLPLQALFLLHYGVSARPAFLQLWH